MGLRFRKSIKIAPGVRLNIGKKSVGISAGVKGARVSVNSKGRVTKTVGIPGTGISYTETDTIGKKKDRNAVDTEPELEPAEVPQIMSYSTQLNVIRVICVILCTMTAVLMLVYPIPCFCVYVCSLWATTCARTATEKESTGSATPIYRRKLPVIFAAIGVVWLVLCMSVQ